MACQYFSPQLLRTIQKSQSLQKLTERNEEVWRITYVHHIYNPPRKQDLQNLETWFRQ